nr:autotransporter assembly complex family protein [Echinimonas agarilytica]
MLRGFIFFIVLVASTSAFAEILTVSIKGTDKQQSANIRAYLGKVPETEQLRASFIFNARSASEKAMQAIGYYHSSVKLDLDKSKKVWHLTLHVHPGPETTLTEVSIRVLGEAKDHRGFKKIGQESGLIVGKRLNHGAYNEVKSQLLSRGLNLGFFDSKLTQSRIEVNRNNNTAKVFLEYDSGPRNRLGEVTFVGTDLESDLLYQMVDFEPGSPYRSRKLNKLNSELAESGYFSSIKVLPLIDERSDNIVPVRVELTPAPRHKVDLGVGYSTDSKGRVSTTWRTPKINKYGHSQETKLEYSKVNPYLRFRYNVPLEHPTNDVLQFGLGVESNEYADLDSTMYTALIGRNTVNDGWVRQYYVRYLQERWDVLEDRNRGEFILPGITLSKLHRRGNPLDPEHGFRQIYLMEMAGEELGSDATIVRAQAQFKWVNRFAEKHRLVTRANFGASYNEDRELSDVPPSLRFYAGGDESIRGFSYQSLGPRIDYVDAEGEDQTITIGGRYLAVGSLEYQYYVTEKWRVVTFSDFGNAFDDVETDIEAAYSVGGGVHWMSPVGAIKVEVGYGISEDDPPWRLHISMGAEL